MDLPTRDDLQTLSQPKNVAISLYLPTHEAGAATRENHIRFKNRLQVARERLEARGYGARDIDTLLEPGQKRVNDNPFWQHQRQGLAMFLSDEGSLTYPLPYPPEELTSVSERFHLKPLLPLLTGDGRFFILAVSLERARLLEATRYSLSEVPLEDVPTSLEEALRFDDTLEQSLRAHTAAGPRGGSAGSLPAQSVIEPDRKNDIWRFFTALDNGVRKILEPQGSRIPLVFVGNGAHFPIYKEANHYGGLLDEAVETNPDELRDEVLHERAWQRVEPHFTEARERDAALFKQRAGSDPERVSEDLHDILPASQDARVETLFVPLGVYRWGTYDPEARRADLHDEAGPESYDLYDLAAVQTLNSGGTVYALELGTLPGKGDLAAIYRF